ncbi:MAG: glycosyltransferase [Tannerella sp.]|jgi:glycosyltransferase involved in cell wall biosynthesis|nr:glycosyltransferase [Tannerella sp.]
MKHLYLFEEATGNAAVFGVGTYIKNLLSVLKEEDIKITVCRTIGSHTELDITYDQTIRYIHIPAPADRYADKRDYYTNVFFVVYPFIDKDEKNVFHFNYLNCSKIAGLLKQHTHAKILLTIHYRQLSTSENKDAEREFVNEYCDKIIVLSRHAYVSLLNDFSVNPEKIMIIPNGIEDRFEWMHKDELQNIREYFNISPNEKVITFAGRLDANKNISVLIRAFLQVEKTDKSIRLVIAGTGDFSSAFSAISHSWGKITFTGFLNKQDLYKLYQITDLGVIPSVYEEFGYVAVEMMMHQIPVIANDTSGLAEIIENNISGKLVNIFSKKTERQAVITLSDSIEKMLTNKHVCLQMGINGRKCFLENYEISLFKKEMIKLYNTLF